MTGQDCSVEKDVTANQWTQYSRTILCGEKFAQKEPIISNSEGYMYVYAGPVPHPPPPPKAVHNINGPGPYAGKDDGQKQIKLACIKYCH